MLSATLFKRSILENYVILYTMTYFCRDIDLTFNENMTPEETVTTMRWFIQIENDLIKFSFLFRSSSNLRKEKTIHLRILPPTRIEIYILSLFCDYIVHRNMKFISIHDGSKIMLSSWILSPFFRLFPIRQNIIDIARLLEVEQRFKLSDSLLSEK